MSAELADYSAPTDPEQVDQRFTILDDAQATWAMRKLRTILDRRDEIAKVAQIETARIASWANEQSAILTPDEQYFTGLLIEYARRQRDEGRKSLSLPYGSVRSRAGGKRLDFVDETAFIEWARVNQPELIRVKESVNKINATAFFLDAADENLDLLVDEKTGEIIPGVNVLQSQTTYTVDIERSQP